MIAEKKELINCKTLRELAIQNIKEYCILTGESEDTIKNQLFIWADEFNIKSPQEVYSEFYELSCKLNSHSLIK
jgi:hypothetical protein